MLKICIRLEICTLKQLFSSPVMSKSIFKWEISNLIADKNMCRETHFPRTMTVIRRAPQKGMAAKKK